MKKLSCHCNKVQIELAIDNLDNLVRCNCSICTKKGTIMKIIDPDAFKIISGKEYLSEYNFHTKVARHFFCKICGIYTHHNPRRDPKLFGVNVACIENFSVQNNQDIKTIDGKNHPLDKK